MSRTLAHSNPCPLVLSWPPERCKAQHDPSQTQKCPKAAPRWLCAHLLFFPASVEVLQFTSAACTCLQKDMFVKISWIAMRPSWVTICFSEQTQNLHKMTKSIAFQNVFLATLWPDSAQCEAGCVKPLGASIRFYIDMGGPKPPENEPPEPVV